jgi:hypothetical protein
LFPKLKSRVKDHHFQTLDSVQKAVTDAIKTLIEADFQSCCEAWKICRVKCIASKGCYFEGDSVDLDEYLNDFVQNESHDFVQNESHYFVNTPPMPPLPHVIIELCVTN